MLMINKSMFNFLYHAKLKARLIISIHPLALNLEFMFTIQGPNQL